MGGVPDPGLFEILVSDALAVRLQGLRPELVEHEPLKPAEAADRIALIVSRVVARVIESLDADARAVTGVEVARRVVELLAAGHPGAGVVSDAPDPRALLLRAVHERLPDGRPNRIPRPLIPLLDTTVLTNAPGEPAVGHQINTEIASADRIDVVMAFIRRSGIKPLEDALRRHCALGRPLRVLTTIYTGSTERGALDALVRLGADVRVSYDTGSTRLHAKAWIFHRDSGFSTAYIGSSNLTHSAQLTGLEWNVRASGARNPDVLSKISAVVDAYWEGGDFVEYDPEVFESSVAPVTAPTLLSPIEITLRPFQERLLERLDVARAAGRHRNLLVSATGTGKTVMAAADYARLRSKLSSDRLLFVAHRSEILNQSLATFRHVLRDGAFGEQWVGGRRPARFDHVFASVQSLASNGLEHLDPEHFDVVVIDEFHHAAAPTYRRLIDRLEPQELLGLTATPERGDGEPILDWFDGRIAAELRLWDAVDQHYLAPFAYYGIADNTDLRGVPWQRGRGYEVDALSNVYTSDRAWARRVLHELTDHVGDPRQARTLGFCVSVAHAEFMAQEFTSAGVPARAVTGSTGAHDRETALRELDNGQLPVVFSVDLFSEGVDVPSVDTLLMLRPTDSGLLFLQQLGRGLRRAPNKSVCTVLDFVANHRKEFRYDRRFTALLGGTRKDVQRQIESQFPFLPAGCVMQLDPVAQERVLRSIRDALPSRWREKVAELQAVATHVGDPSLSRFLGESGLDLTDVYDSQRDHCWTRLRADAGLPLAAPGPHDDVMLRGVARLAHVDDPMRLNRWLELLDIAGSDLAHRREQDRRLARMLTATLMSQLKPLPERTLVGAWDLLRSHRRVTAELQALLAVLTDRVEHVLVPLAGDSPLQVHARYSRIEVLAGLGAGARDEALTPDWREGVKWIPDERADALLITLDKTQGGFSPTTRYRDYAISPELFHWESQSTTSAESPTGRRYQRHRAEQSTILLFARVRDTDAAFWFLGSCDYVQHRGSRPMAVTWRLHHRLPGDLFAEFAAAVA